MRDRHNTKYTIELKVISTLPHHPLFNIPSMTMADYKYPHDFVSVYIQGSEMCSYWLPQNMNPQNMWKSIQLKWGVSAEECVPLYFDTPEPDVGRGANSHAVNEVNI